MIIVPDDNFFVENCNLYKKVLTTFSLRVILIKKEVLSMKTKLLSAILILVTCAFICGCGVDDDVNEYVYADYPLIEYTFDENDEWIVVICEDVYETDGEYYVNDNEKSLELGKELLVVNTYPEGRGTTPEHLVWIYKNGELLKYVQCLDYEFLSDSFENDFKEVYYEDVAHLIKLDS